MSEASSVEIAIKNGIKAARYKAAAIALVAGLIYVLLLSYVVYRGSVDGNEDVPHVGVVKVDGAIMPDKDASAASVIESIRAAEENPHTVGIILSINSPGGSPIQAERIYDEVIRQTKAHPDKKIVAVINELGASAAYYIASSAPKIYASRASLVGSIGVTGSGYGFTGLMDKLGIQRRVYAAGEHKLFLDAFSPQNDQETQFFKGVLGQVHEEFIERVKDGRGERLKWKENPGVFSGLIWAGAEAKRIGLIDEIGTIDSVLQGEFKNDKVVVYEKKKPVLQQFAGMIGASVYQQIGESLEFKGAQM